MTDWKETTGAKLYRRAKRRIPGGTQLLSKRPEMFLPDQWPAYYSKCKGCEVWDLDGRRFIDMTTTGIGSCLLGYADDDVNEAVRRCIERGGMSTLNSPVEVELADLLCDLHRWAGMVRYSRTGGEAMAVAVRIARAYTGRDKVAVCGYHGWSDWYLAANLSDEESLDDLLLPGLEPRGVPKGLTGTVLPFHFGRIEELEAAAGEHGDQIAAVVMEPMRWDLPKEGFLEKIRDIASRIGAVLVFDEITVGWRFALGGSHLMLGVSPDIAVFAKATSNGFPFAAVIGAEEVMQAAQGSFISSTYWTEAIGPTAALATIRKMQAIDVPEHVERIGRRVQDGWKRLAEEHQLNLNVRGLPALCHLTLDYGRDSQALMTLLTQCMLDSGFLAAGAFYPTCAHTEQIVDDYLAALGEVFGILKQAIDEGDVASRLNGPVAHETFRRLN